MDKENAEHILQWFSSVGYSDFMLENNEIWGQPATKPQVPWALLPRVVHSY